MSRVPIDREDLLGAWRQLEPDPGPASILVTFQRDGQISYALESGPEPSLLLRWSAEGFTLTIEQPDSGEKNVSRFHFESFDVLVLEYQQQRFVYKRC